MTAQRSPVFLLLVAVAWLGGAPLPAEAQQDVAFGLSSARELVLPEFADREVAALLTALDGAIVGPRPEPSVDAARHTLWTFAKRLQAGRLSPSQESAVLAHLDHIGRTHPAFRDPIKGASFMVRALTVGKTAPEMTGQDLAGSSFRLSDYRGKVVVVTFSADWCAICRSQHPYLRLMQELYANWPFAILGVETGAAETVQRLKAQHGLEFRSVWDGTGGDAGRGQITTAWNVLGWPTTYVLDADGVIRFVDLRDEDLLKGVRQLLAEHMDRADAAVRRQRH
jgi:peroxiredoxin